jgi:hypothetical protein
MDRINDGKIICSTNSFYNTLSLLLRYYFLNNIDTTSLIQDVTKSQIEFQVFMIYKNYAIDLYNNHRKILDNMSYENIIYYIVSTLKTNYDKDRKVLEPYITSINENKNDIIEKYNYIKSSYLIKTDKISKLNDIISLLEEAKQYEIQSTKCRDKALSLVYDLHQSFDTKTDLKLLKY